MIGPDHAVLLEHLDIGVAVAEARQDLNSMLTQQRRKPAKRRRKFASASSRRVSDSKRVSKRNRRLLAMPEWARAS